MASHQCPRNLQVSLVPRCPRSINTLASMIAFMVGCISVNGQRPLDSRRSYIQTFTNLHINVGIILLRNNHFICCCRSTISLVVQEMLCLHVSLITAFQQKQVKMVITSLRKIFQSLLRVCIITQARLGLILQYVLQKRFCKHNPDTLQSREKLVLRMRTKRSFSIFLDKNIMEISLTVKVNSVTIPHLDIVGISTFMSVFGGITPAALQHEHAR